MPDDRTLEILIKFGLDSAKAKEAAAALSDLTQKTKAAGAAAGEYSSRSDKVFKDPGRDKGIADTSKALGELEKNIGQTSAQTSKWALTKKQLHDVLRLLPPEIREMGMALRAAFSNPIVAAITAVVVVVKLVVDAFSRFNQEIALVKMDNLRKGMDDTAQAAARAAASTTEFEESIANLKSAGQEQDAESSKRITILRAEKEAADKVAEAEKARALANAKDAPSRARIEAAYNQSAMGRNQSLRDAELTERKGLLGRKGAEAERLTSAVSTADQDVYDKTRATEEAKVILANADAGLAALAEKAKTGPLTPAEWALKRQLTSTSASAGVMVDENSGKQSAAVRNRDRLRSQLTAAVNSVSSLQNEIGTTGAVNEIASGSENRVATLERSTSIAATGRFGRAGVAALDLARDGRVGDPANAQALNEIAKELRLRQRDYAALLQVLRGYLTDGVVTKQEEANIRKDIARLQAGQSRHPK